MTVSSPPPTLGQVIRARRIALGISQETLATRVSDLGSAINQADISRIELGKVGLPRRRRLEHLAAALELSLGDLLEASGWIGAGERFAEGPRPWPPERAPSAMVTAVPVGRQIHERSAPAWTRGGNIDARATIDAVMRLRTAVSLSHESVARAAWLMQECHKTAERWDPGWTRRDSSPHHPSSSAIVDPP